MNAPPTFNINELNLNKINCFEHQNNLIVGICIDTKCENENKLMCIDCMFGNHSGHIGVKINEIEEIYKTNLEEYINKSKDEALNKKHQEFNEFLKKKVDEFRKRMNEYIEEYYNNFLQEINDDSNEINNIYQNCPPKNKTQLNILGKNLIQLYNKKKKNIKKEPKLNLEKYNLYEKSVIKELELIENYFKKLKESPLNPEEIFEWSKKTYENHGFYYQLEENNTKVTKILKGGTMTVVRSINPLEKGNKYKLDYYIHYINGDFDVGFGDDNIGKTCWICGNNCYSVSNRGIFVDGQNKKSENNIVNRKKITFIVDLKKFVYQIFFDDEKMYDFNCNSQLTYYPMIAIRELNNSVKLKLYKIKDE